MPQPPNDPGTPEPGAPAGPAGPGDATRAGGGAPRSRARILTIVLAVAVGAVVVALFFIGMLVGQGGVTGRSLVSVAPTGSATPSATPSVTPSAAATPTPAPTAAAPVGPAAPGVHAWDELGGGECLTGFASPWDPQFTVVDCASDHTAQLVSTGLFAEDAVAAYPGEAELVSRLNLLCTAPAALDYDAAGAVPDVQWQASYPATDAEWAAGDRRYYCFFSRTSGQPLGASLAPVAAG